MKPGLPNGDILNKEIEFKCSAKFLTAFKTKQPFYVISFSKESKFSIQKCLQFPKE